MIRATWVVARVCWDELGPLRAESGHLRANLWTQVRVGASEGWFVAFEGQVGAFEGHVGSSELGWGL